MNLPRPSAKRDRVGPKILMPDCAKGKRIRRRRLTYWCEIPMRISFLIYAHRKIAARETTYGARSAMLAKKARKPPADPVASQT